VSYVLAAAGFALLIILHEAGHFTAAKAVGMRVERFFLFFPPKIVSTKRGETEYGIGAIPAGGFVKITGMNPDEELPPEVASRGYYKQPVWKRIVVIAAGPVVNVVIAFLLLFGLAFGVHEATKRVSDIDADTPAERVLQPGDRIVSVDGVRGDQVEIADQIDSHKCAGTQTDGCVAKTPAKLRVERDGKLITIAVRPRYDASVDRNRIGFSFGTRPLDPSVAGAAKLSGQFMWEVSSKTVSVIARLFDPEDRKQVSGVVGSYEVTRQAINFGPREALTLLAVISLSLGLINLFPFLPLDGGHIFWSLVEKLRGRPVPFSVMERAGAIGFVLVIMLFFIGLSNDIGRLTGEGFSAR
jgi:regulator of sigma E protease